MSEIERLRGEIAELERECERRLSSGRYRLGALFVETARDWRQWPSFPGRAWRLWRQLRARRRPPQPDSAQFEFIRKRISVFANQVREVGADHVLFIFSGTTYIQGVRGNRPIRQALEARNAGIPVLFSYHRTRYDDSPPEGQDPGLLQVPADITMQLLRDVAELDLGEAFRIFLVSYPLPGIETSITCFRAKGWSVIYDCRDDWAEFRKVSMANWYRRGVECKVVTDSNATMCVSKTLCDKMQEMVPHARVELSPNAVDVKLLDGGISARVPGKPPIIGYFGHLSPAWFDWPALVEIAHARPQYRFQIIGHSAPAGLDLPSNVELCGPQPWNRLGEYAATWSVGVVPFRIGPLADGVDPVKVYEYLAYGLPVVSFRMPQIEDYPYVTTVGGVADFCEALDIACDLQPDSATIQEFLARNTWTVRIRQLLELAGEVTR